MLHWLNLEHRRDWWLWNPVQMATAFSNIISFGSFIVGFQLTAITPDPNRCHLVSVLLISVIWPRLRAKFRLASSFPSAAWMKIADFPGRSSLSILTCAHELPESKAPSHWEGDNWSIKFQSAYLKLIIQLFIYLRIVMVTSECSLM